MGEKMDDDIKFTNDQADALDALDEFCASNRITFLLSGSAGTGKTTLMQHFVKRCNLKIMGLAPTHKAKKVLKARLLNNPVCTLASFLQKIPKHSYIGSKTFSAGVDEGNSEYGLYILDEVSMVSDGDFKLLKIAASRTKSKIVAIGDECQIPAISQKLEEMDGMLVKKPCSIFKLSSRADLREIVRQSTESPILRAAHFLRGNLDRDVKLIEQFPTFTLEREKLYEIYKNCDMKAAKIIAYTNKAVENHNQCVRIAQNRVDLFVRGEILMGYQTIGYPKPFIENSGDYIVERVKYDTNGLRQGMCGWTLHLKSDFTDPCFSVFFPEISAPQNQPKLAKLIELARKVNAHKSTRKDYAMYKSLKDKMLFLQNIYEYDEGILVSESEFKEAHPLLFISLSELVDETGILLTTENVDSIVALYGNVIRHRLNDDKAIGEQETLASQYCVFEKDLDYGYACTAHKAQGSTLQTVFVDEPDFERLKNRFNSRYGLIENKTREKNQLKYVAITRASDTLYILK